MASGKKVPRSEYPRPQLVRKQWLCLNGQWSFGIVGSDNGVAAGLPASGRLDGEIVVPFAPESRRSGIGNRDFMPCVWYSRKFRVPAGWRGRRVRLHLGAVDYEATVWVNGQQVGFHRGGFTPMAFDITDALTGGSNLLVVRAVDDTRGGLQACGKQSVEHQSRGCRYTRVTGIWQSVWLEPVGRSFIRRLRMVGDPASGRLHIQAVIDGGGALSMSAEARAGGEIVGRANADASTAIASCTIELSTLRPWQGDDPFLYDLELKLRDEDGVVDSVSSYFGLRTVSIDGPAILINGQPLFQRLVLDQGYYPTGIYTAPSDADLKRDIVLGKRLGFNGARLHQKVFEPRFLYWADRLGYLVWGEYGDWGIDRTSGEAARRVMNEWTEVVERDFNHPSIIGWCPLNEAFGWADRQWLRDVYRHAKALDATRPVIDSSGYDHYETDVYDAHNYEQDPRKFAAAFKDFATGGEPYRNSPAQGAYAGQPYFVSEYGGTGWDARARDGVGRGDGQRKSSWGYGDAPQDVAEFYERYRRLTTTLLRHPRMCGFCYTQLYDVEQEINGLMTYGRKMKFDPAIIAAINTKPAAIEKG